MTLFLIGYTEKEKKRFVEDDQFFILQIKAPEKSL